MIPPKGNLKKIALAVLTLPALGSCSEAINNNIGRDFIVNCDVDGDNVFEGSYTGSYSQIDHYSRLYIDGKQQTAPAQAMYYEGILTLKNRKTGQKAIYPDAHCTFTPLK